MKDSPHSGQAAVTITRVTSFLSITSLGVSRSWSLLSHEVYTIQNGVRPMIQATFAFGGNQYVSHQFSRFPEDRIGCPTETKIVCDDIMVIAIAMLSDEEVEAMTHDDLVDAVRAARNVPQFPIEPERIAHRDNGHLRRVLYAVRRWMRTRCNEQTRERGWMPFFRDL